MKRVLVVDDERDVADAMGELLSDTYQVTVCYDATEALQTLERESFDAILLDLMMPKMSGEELMRELIARKIRTPVIFASAAPNLAQRAKQSGARDYLAKPFDWELLERKLARVLGTSGNGGNGGSPGEAGGAGAEPGPKNPKGDGGGAAERPRATVRRRPRSELRV